MNALSQVNVVAEQLGRTHGYRTLWLAADGGLWHAEPEIELENAGYRYVGTFLRPSVDQLEHAVLRVLGPSVVDVGSLMFAHA